MNTIAVYASYVVTVLPMLFGLAKWKSLPDKMAIHFGIDGNPNGYAPKLVPVVIVPIFLLIVQFICVTAVNGKAANVSPIVLVIETWIVPVVSIIVAVSIYRFALK